MDELKKLRNDLDMCDEILIDALRMRCQIIQEITNYKQKNGLPIYQAEEEERKKSKMTFILDHKPSRKEEKMIEDRMNELLAEDLPVTYEVVDRDHIPADVQIDRLPEDASEKIRLVRIGNYDVCPCIGKHVRSTAQIGKFVLLGTNWDEMTKAFRVRFKIVQ